jgi:hypothetical protein
VIAVAVPVGAADVTAGFERPRIEHPALRINADFVSLEPLRRDDALELGFWRGYYQQA